MYVHNHLGPSWLCNKPLEPWPDLCALTAEAKLSRANETAVYVCTQPFQPLSDVQYKPLKPWSLCPQCWSYGQQSKWSCSVCMYTDISTPLGCACSEPLEPWSTNPRCWSKAKQDKLQCLDGATPTPLGCAMSHWNRDLYALAAEVSKAMEAAINCWNHDPHTLTAEVSKTGQTAVYAYSHTSPPLDVQWAVETRICMPSPLEWAMQWKLQCIYVHSYLGTPWVCTEARVCNEAYPPCLAGWYLIYCYHSCQLVYLPLNSEHCVDRDICADHFLYSIHLKLSYANRHPDRKVAGCFLLSCLY